ncbi:hypothetical protein HWV23_15275 [Natronomonas halophila]|nr:hypothetical protein [Natronomonas halophila]QLD87027.1 hypothetical protein HWV23_15275 [Natronomonas halophila]
MRAYKLLLATLLLVFLLAVVVEGTALEVLQNLWENFEDALSMSIHR